MEKRKKVFISYSWDSEDHKEWVLKLADYLIEKGGCDVDLDQYDLNTGNNMNLFMEKSVADSDIVLLILTPNYKLKADKREGGVGMEYSMISQGMYSMQKNNSKFLPILREGTLDKSAPTYVQTTIYQDMKNDLMFDKNAFKLLRTIYNKPLLIKPKIGNIPIFEESKKVNQKQFISDGFAASAKKLLEEKKLLKDLKDLETSEKGYNKVFNDVKLIFISIQNKSKKYATEIGFPIYIEFLNNNNTLRLQADDFYVTLTFESYSQLNINSISLKINSGEDKYFQPNKNKENIIYQIATLYSTKQSEVYKPLFNKTKEVVWGKDEMVFRYNEIIDRVFSMLLEEMTNNWKNE